MEYVNHVKLVIVSIAIMELIHVQCVVMASTMMDSTISAKNVTMVASIV